MILLGCFRRLFLLAMLVLVLGAAWVFREPLRQAWSDARGLRGPAALPTPELAELADQKLAALRAGTADRAALSELELQSLVRYRYAGILPGFVDSAQVELDESRIRLRARVPLDKLPRLDELGEAAAFLPDTTELTLEGTLLPLDSGRVAFAVDQVTAAGIPLPRRLVPGALRRLGRADEPGLPADAVPLRLPPGASSGYIRADSLVLLRRLGGE